MHRRHFVAGVSAGLAGTALGATSAAEPLAAMTPSPAAGAADRSVYELRTYELRNDLDVARAHEFFARHLVPALRRAGAGPVGAFSPDVGLPTASIVLLVPHASMAAAGTAAERLASDAALRSAMDAWEGTPGRGAALPYVRYDVALYRAFAGHPALEAGSPPAAGRPPRVFEWRTYEAPSEAGLRAKVRMFDEEEVWLFRDVGFSNVWFGEAVAGARLPHLSYMVAFDDMAARAAAWGRFGASPVWQRIRGRPGWTDPEAVSTIRAAFLRPTAYSEVR